MDLFFSIVVPVYNRPEELRELLGSLSRQTYARAFEVVIVEDGSQKEAAGVVRAFSDTLEISYLKKPNTGPGDSRNFGMRHARGNYYILVDSDCILPEAYLEQVHSALQADFADCFGGPDAAHPSFTDMQKAISFVMTSVLTTGGIRGNKQLQKDFQPRSFNMGLSAAAFAASGGFGNIHPGEDPDLSLRLKGLGYRLKYIPEAVVYHKRRITWQSFYRQVNRFGQARPILNRWHPGTARITYWFPTLFCAWGVLALFLPLLWSHGLAVVPAACLISYLLAVLVSAWWTTGHLRIGLRALLALLVQFTGYGWGFLKSASLLTFSNKKPQDLLPGLFFTRTP